MEKIKLQAQTDGTHVVIKAGAAALCPFKNSILVPGAIDGQLTIQQFPCTTACPLCSYSNKESTLAISCGTAVVSFEVTELHNTAKSNLRIL